MEKGMKILFATFEAEPFAKTGGLGDVCGSLPKALNKAGCDARVILPKFSTIPEPFKNDMRHVADFYVDLVWRKQYCGFETLTYGGVTFYFIDNEYYFERCDLYGYEDDGERAAFFSKAVLACLPHMTGFFPDIIHCHDWQTALIPIYLRELYRMKTGYGEIKTVFTIHNLKFQGIFPRHDLGDVLGLEHVAAASDQLTQYDTINYLRGGLNYSDRLTTVSPSYAREICTEYYGEKVQDILVRRCGVLSGILNGIDTEKFDPAAGADICEAYDSLSLEKKSKNKLSLQKELGLNADPDIPLAVIISRLTEQKGLDLVLGVLDEILREKLQLAVLGVGDRIYEAALKHFESKYQKQMAVRLVFDEGLSKRFYAGADMIMIPSKFEPCGLTQMIAMRYGTLPIVRETGGLRDSVVPYNKNTGEGNGFGFVNFNAHELLFTVQAAVRLYEDDRKAWNSLAVHAMREDFTWDASAKKYIALYESLLKASRG